RRRLLGSASLAVRGDGLRGDVGQQLIAEARQQVADVEALDDVGLRSPLALLRLQELLRSDREQHQPGTLRDSAARLRHLLVPGVLDFLRRLFVRELCRLAVPLAVDLNVQPPDFVSLKERHWSLSSSYELYG